MSHQVKTIALLHHVSGSNLGDSGTLEAVLQNIRKRWPEATVIGLTMNPEDTLKRHGITAYPIRQRTWSFGGTRATGSGISNRVTFYDRVKAAASGHPFFFKLLAGIKALAIGLPGALLRELFLLARSFGIMWPVDLLIICGGGQFLESCGGPLKIVGGPWQFPFTIFKWTLLARAVGAKVMILNVGAGPLVRPLTKCFVKGSLALSNYNSFRDEESQTLIHNIGFQGQTHVFPDSAYSLESHFADETPVSPRIKPMVGFAPMAYDDPRLSPSHDPAIYNGFIQRLGTFGSSLIKKGYCLKLFCTDISIDPPAIQDVETILRGSNGPVDPDTAGTIHRVHQWTTEELLENMSTMDYVVAVRFHAVVFAHMLNKPVLAISHHPKVMALMNGLGLSEYCVDIRTCDPDVLAEKFASLVANRDQIKDRMAEKLAGNKRRLLVQFDGLFPPQAAGDANVLSGGTEQLSASLAWLAHPGRADDAVAHRIIEQMSGLRFVRQLKQRSRAALITTSLLLVASIGYVDYITGPDISCSVFYLLAIGLAAWFVGRGFAVFLSFLSVAVWFFGDLAGGAHFSSPLVMAWNAVILVSHYLIVVWLLAILHSFVREFEARIQQSPTTMREETREAS